jgi:hypothetical protein
MKKFTLKDFILHNSPCFSCAELITFQIGIINIADLTMSESFLKASVLREYTSIDLHIGWNDTLKLNIDHKSNKFATNNASALTKYLEGRKLFFKCECSKCHSGMLSNHLEFSAAGFIRPVSINRETIVVYDNVNMYQIYSLYDNNQSTIFIDRIDKAIPISPIRLDTPLLPRSKFKNKGHLIEKLKTYILFS